MTQRTGGRHHSICRDDWTTYAGTIVSESFEPRSFWSLSARADPATLHVTVDGAPVSAGPNGYRYETGKSRLVFSDVAVPQGGQRIDVHYSPACQTG